MLCHTRPAISEEVTTLNHQKVFEQVALDDATDELTEFSEDAEDLAFELAYTRYRVAKLELFIRNGVENGYIKIPDKPDPARDTIDEVIG